MKHDPISSAPGVFYMYGRERACTARDRKDIPPIFPSRLKELSALPAISLILPAS